MPVYSLGGRPVLPPGGQYWIAPNVSLIGDPRGGFDRAESFSVTRGLDPRVHGSPGQARSSPAMTDPDGST